jgi:hypothetical protein
MARKYSRKASAKVGRAMKKRKAGTLKSGRSGRKVKSRKQAIAIGLSEARAEGKKVPKKVSKKRKTAKKRKGSEHTIVIASQGVGAPRSDPCRRKRRFRLRVSYGGQVAPGNDVKSG